MDIITMPGEIPTTVAAKLRSLRRRVAAWFLVDGVSRLLFWVIVLIGVDLGADWLFRMDRPQRAIMLVLMLLVLAVVLFLRLVRPLSVSFGDDALCLKVEDRHKHLGESLISAVQFSRMKDLQMLGISPALVRATINLGVREAGNVDFGNVLNRRRFRINSAMLVLLLAGVFGIVSGVIWCPNLSLWYRRNILLADEPWPWDTYLIVQGVRDGRLTIPRGDEWTLAVDWVGGAETLPEMVYVDFRPAYGRPSELLKKVDAQQRFQAKPMVVAEPFRFRVRSDRSRTPWIGVDLVDRPEVKELRLVATAPEYAGGKKAKLPAERGPHHVLKGSLLEVRGVANKLLSKATLRIGGHQQACEVFDKIFRTTVSPERLGPGTYHIDLVDARSPEPLQSRRSTQFTLKIKPDREPQVRVRMLGISAMVVPGAHIPLSCSVTDDHAVTTVRLAYRWRSEQSDATGNTGVVQLDQYADKLGGKTVTAPYVLELAPWSIPAGSGLRFVIEADDNDDVSGPNTGKSTEFLLKVVSEAVLRSNLLRREKEQRQELERILKIQEDLQTRSDVLLATVRDKPDLPAEQRKELMQIQKRQKLLGTNLGGVAERLQNILIEIQNNHLEEEDGPLQNRLRKRIIEPLEKLSQEAMPDAARHLDQTRRLAGSSEQRDKALAAAIARQKEIAGQLRKILAQMAKAESYQEAVNLLYEIVKSQQDVRKLTVEEAQERIRQILEDGEGDGEGDADGEGAGEGDGNGDGEGDGNGDGDVEKPE